MLALTDITLEECRISEQEVRSELVTIGMATCGGMATSCPIGRPLTGSSITNSN